MLCATSCGDRFAFEDDLEGILAGVLAAGMAVVDGVVVSVVVPAAALFRLGAMFAD
jgi:hypothetical protein